MTATEEYKFIQQMISGSEQSVARAKELLASFEQQLAEARQAMDDFLNNNKE